MASSHTPEGSSTTSAIGNRDAACAKRCALVTGGTSGIGLATVIEFAKLGYKVAFTGRNKERLVSQLTWLASQPAYSAKSFFAIQADFIDPNDVETAIKDTLAEFGRLDVLVNNAGCPYLSRDIFDQDFYDDFKNTLQVNLLAPTRMSQIAAPYLVRSKGVIINVSSIADRVAFPVIGYCVAKAGLSMLTKCLANSFENTGVRVVTVSPGPIKTNFAPNIDRLAPATLVNRPGEAKEVADLILFLASDKANFITGTTIDIDGGFSAKLGRCFRQEQPR